MAPNKKYLSLEDAAILLGVQPEELIRLREKGEIRGFADRGTWKFKADDVAEYRRRQQPDSDPDLQLIDEDDIDDSPAPQRPSRNLNSDSDVRLILADDPQPKRLSGSSADLKTIDLMKSDSDVRLVEAPEPKKGSDSDVKLVKPKSPSKADSDSDVKMMEIDLDDSDSDSDVKLLDSGVSIDSDSDVRLAQSDSDVRLAPLSGSDSDVKLASKKPGIEDDSDSDVILLPRGGKHRTDPMQETSPVSPMADSGSLDFDLRDDDSPLAGDSGIMLAGEDSGIQLAGEDSGIQLADEDSGIRLGGDSGIRLSQDSGVQLMQPADSGISLEGQDSGIRFADSGMTLDDSSGVRSSGGKKKGSGKKRPPSDSDFDDLDLTNPMLLSDSDEDDDLGAVTNALSLDEDDAGSVEFEDLEARDTSELQALGDSGNDIVIFDDEEEDVSTMSEVKGKRKPAGESLFEIDEADEEALEELEVSDEDLSGESDYDDLPFEDGGDELSEYSEGSSQIDIEVPRKAAVVPEAEWSAGVLGLLFASLSLMIVGTLVSSDLLRTVWGTSQESSVDSGIAWLLSSLWK